MTTTRVGVTPSGMFDDDALDYVRDVLAGVDRVLQDGVDVLPLDDVDRVSAVREEVGDRAAGDSISLILEPMDLDPMRSYALEALELLEAADDFLALLDDDRGLGRRSRRGLLDLVQDAGIGDLLDEVENVVQAADELLDVLAVERRDERLLEPMTDVVTDAVALVFKVDQLACDPLALVV